MTKWAVVTSVRGEKGEVLMHGAMSGFSDWESAYAGGMLQVAQAATTNRLLNAPSTRLSVLLYQEHKPQEKRCTCPITSKSAIHEPSCPFYGPP